MLENNLNNKIMEISFMTVGYIIAFFFLLFCAYKDKRKKKYTRTTTSNYFDISDNTDSDWKEKRMYPYSKQSTKNINNFSLGMINLAHFMYMMYILCVIHMWFYSFQTNSVLFVLVPGTIIAWIFCKPGYSHFLTGFILLSGTIIVFIMDAFSQTLDYLSTPKGMFLLITLLLPNTSGMILGFFETDDMARERWFDKDDYWQSFKNINNIPKERYDVLFQRIYKKCE